MDGGGSLVTPTPAKDTLPKPPKTTNTPVNQQQNTNYNTGTALRDTSRTPSVRTEAVIFDEGDVSGESDEDDIGDQTVDTEKGSVQTDEVKETEEVTGKEESSNVGTETRIETVGEDKTRQEDTNSDNPNDLLTNINYYAIYNDLISGISNELYSRSPGMVMRIVKNTPKTSVKLANEMFEGTIKTVVNYGDDTVSTLIRSLDDLASITNAFGILTMIGEVAINIHEGDSVIESVAVVGGSAIAGYVAAELATFALTAMAVTSPIALLVVPVIVGAIASELSNKEIERSVI